MNIINFAVPEITGAFGWLVELIKWLSTITGSIALGVILFTVLLKLITLPFDYSSKKTMKKNSIKMEEMRPELEKLQRQYADNKELYNQKMMALYKKNGYSLFGSCLPVILSLVIFIIAIGAFNDYSQYQNRQYFYDMSVSYNQVIYDGLEADGVLVKVGENSLTVDDQTILTLVNDGQNEKTSEGIRYNIGKSNDETGNYIYVKTDASYIKYVRYYDEENVFGAIRYEVVEKGLESGLGKDLVNFEGKKYTVVKGSADVTALTFLEDVCQTASADTFKNNNSSFYWIKNIWVSDSAFSHPVNKDWDSFRKEQEYDTKKGDMNEASYKQLIAKLGDYTDAPNGYFILVILTAGFSLLLQLITTKSQKAQMELQTVDGQGMQTQKVMNVMMPIMMGVFAFMYTAAFSIYIIISNIISIGSTLLINKIVTVKYGSAEPKTEVIRGRVYEPKQEEKAPEKKKKKEQEISKNDFLSGYADRKNRK